MATVHAACKICIRPLRRPCCQIPLAMGPTMTDAWWEAPVVLSAVQMGDTGTVLRLARRAKGETQR
jgi:hypothetical protein